MGFRQLIARFIAVERRVKQAFPISAVPPLIAQETSRGTIIRDTRTAGYLEDFDGWITDKGPNGEKDYADARYFCRKGLPQPNISETDTFTFSMMPPSTDDKGASLKDDIVTVTNEPELQYNAAENTTSPTQTHYLPKGRHVRVRAVYGSDSTKHYVMNETLSGGSFPCTCVTNSATAAGDYGDSSNRATLKYDITPYGGAATVGANLAPKGTPGRVVKNKVAAGSDGSYAYNGTAVVLLTVYNEYAADQENCPAP